MLTEKDYCDLDTSHELWMMGLEPEAYYDGPLILLYEAQKFLREEKNMNVYVKAFNGEGWYYIIQNYKGARIYPPLAKILVLCHFYEEALSEGVRKAVEILKEK